MTDEQLIERLRMVTGFIRFETGDRIAASACLSEEAADRIEALIEESGRRLALARSEGVARVEQFERTEALTEQLAAARQDAKEADAYAEELERELNTCRMAQAVMDNTVADLEAKLAKCEARLGKAVEEAEKYQYAFAAQSRKLQSVLHIDGVRTTLAELTGGKDD